MIKAFSKKHNFLETQETLDYISDIERIISRVTLGTVKPKDLVALQSSFEQLPQL